MKFQDCLCFEVTIIWKEILCSLDRCPKVRKRGSTSKLLSVAKFGYKYMFSNYFFLWIRKFHCHRFFVAAVFVTCYRVPSHCHENRSKQCLGHHLSKVFGISLAVFICLKVEKVVKWLLIFFMNYFLGNYKENKKQCRIVISSWSIAPNGWSWRGGHIARGEPIFSHFLEKFHEITWSSMFQVLWRFYVGTHALL